MSSQCLKGLAFLAVIFIALAVSRPGLARTSPADPNVKRGNTYLKKEEYANATREFLQAARLDASPSIQCYLGQSLFGEGRYDETVAAFNSCLSDMDGLSTEERNQSIELRARARMLEHRPV